MTKIPNNKPVYDLEERTFQFAKAVSSLHADCLTKCVKQFRLGIVINRLFECSVFRGSVFRRKQRQDTSFSFLNSERWTTEHSHYLRRRNNDQRSFKVEANFKYVWLGFSVHFLWVSSQSELMQLLCDALKSSIVHLHGSIDPHTQHSNDFK